MHYRKLIALVRRSAAAVVGALVGALALTATAHDIPTDVKINAFVKPEGHRLEFLIRVPLAAMIEVDFPTRGAGYLELARADEALHHAAKLYLIDNITLYENDVALPPPRIVDAQGFASLRPLVRVIRCRPRPRRRTAACERSRSLLEPAAA